MAFNSKPKKPRENCIRTILKWRNLFCLYKNMINEFLRLVLRPMAFCFQSNMSIKWTERSLIPVRCGLNNSIWSIIKYSSQYIHRKGKCIWLDTLWGRKKQSKRTVYIQMCMCVRIFHITIEGPGRTEYQVWNFKSDGKGMPDKKSKFAHSYIAQTNDCTWSWKYKFKRFYFLAKNPKVDLKIKMKSYYMV